MDWVQVAGIIVAGGLGISGIFKFSSEKVIETALKKALHREQLLAEADLIFRQQQLGELYGPLYATLKLNSQLYPLWIDGKLSEVNQDVIDLFRQQNDEMVHLLKTKAHLIEGAQFPPEFIEYMTSVTVWGMYCTRPDSPYIPDEIAQLEQVRWPKEFEDYVYETTENLKAELNRLRRKYRVK
ncbi:MAG: hypothetical protein AAF685_13155 [Cyanobacteria bacterium P01_C01_bin.89]